MIPRMLMHPNFDPVAVAIGPVKVHWYGLMYLAAFALGWWLGRVRAREAWRGWSRDDVGDVLFWIALGVVAGGRLGYMLFYELERLVAQPWSVFMVWRGGMSFHGGLIGVMAAMWWFGRSRGRGFFEVADFIAPLVPPGLAAGRLGNFINGRLWGTPSDLPWAMVFPDPRAGDAPRHPSQLYEALLEGVVLFAVLWWFTRRPRPAMAASGVFLIGYGPRADPRRVRPGPRCPSRVPRLRLGDDGTGADPADDRGGHGSGGHGGGPARTGRAGETRAKLSRRDPQGGIRLS